MYYIIDNNNKIIGNFPELRTFPNNEFTCVDVDGIEISQDEDGNTIYAPPELTEQMIVAINIEAIKAQAQLILSKTDFWDGVSYRDRHKDDTNPSIQDKDNYRNALRDVVAGVSQNLPEPLYPEFADLSESNNDEVSNLVKLLQSNNVALGLITQILDEATPETTQL